MPGEDEALLSRAKTDGAAARAFFERHGRAVFGLARAILRDEGAAEDATQEAFARAFASADTFDASRGTARTWLLAIARHAAFEALRRRREAPIGEADAEDDAEPLLDLGLAAGWGSEDPERQLARAEQRELLATALAALSPADREIVVLRDLEGLQPGEIARVVGVDVAAAKSRLHRARLRLVAALHALEEGVVAEEREVGGMRCRDVLAVLSDYVDGDLGPTDRVRVEAHLRGCAVCERFGGRFSRVVHDLRERLGAETAVDPAVLASLAARLR